MPPSQPVINVKLEAAAPVESPAHSESGSSAAPSASPSNSAIAAHARSSIRLVQAGLFLGWLLCAFFFIAHCCISSPLLSSSISDRMVLAAYSSWFVAGALMVTISLGFNRSVVSVLRMGMSTLSSAHQKERQSTILKLSTIRAPLVISFSLTLTICTLLFSSRYMRDCLSYSCALLSAYLMVIASVAAQAAPVPTQVAANKVTVMG